MAVVYYEPVLSLERSRLKGEEGAEVQNAEGDFI